MKKLILSAIAVGMISTSAFAEVGAIVKVVAKSNDTAKIVLDPADTAKANQTCIVDLTSAGGRAMFATALTGKSATMNADVYRDASNNCTIVTLLP